MIPLTARESEACSTPGRIGPGHRNQNYWVINPRFDFMEERREASDNCILIQYGLNGTLFTAIYIRARQPSGALIFQEATAVLLGGCVMADEGWFRDKSDNKLVSSADSDMTPPTDHDFILASTIKVVYDDMIYQGGTWDGTAYVPPDNIILPLDLATDVGMLKNAAMLAHDQLKVWREHLDSEAYPHEDVVVVRDFFTYKHRGIRGVMLSTHWTVAQRVKFAEESASGTADANTAAGLTELVEQARENEPAIVPPTSRVIWVNPDTGVPVNLSAAVMLASNHVGDMVAEVTDYTVYTDGEWIDDITD